MRVDVEQELSGRMLKVMLEEEQDDFGAQMLENHHISGVLAPHIHRVNGGVQYLYEVKDWISLREYMNRTAPSLPMVVDMIGQIIDTMEELENYFLNKDNLLIQVDYIYWEEGSKKWHLAYVDGCTQPVENGLAKIAELLMDRMEHTDKKLVFLVYALHRACKEKPFQMAHVKELLEDKEEIFSSEVREMKKEETILPQNVVEDSIVPEKKQRDANNSRNKILFIMGIEAIIVSLFYHLGFLMNSVNGQLDGWKTGGLVLMIACLGIYIWDRISGRKKEPMVQMESFVKPIQPMVLSPKDWQRPPIKFAQSPFLVGSDYSLCDGWVEDENVGRIHAKLLLEESGMFIIDQESKEGTYINGKQSIPWERVEIKPGDELSFAGVCYELQCDS